MDDVLRRTLNSARRKLQSERIIRGLAAVTVFCLAASLLLSYWLVQTNFDDSALFWARVAGGAGLLLVAGRFLLLPALRLPTPRRIARFLEERNSHLQDRLSTAVELQENPSGVHPEILKLIASDARLRVSRLAQPRFFYPRSASYGLLLTGISLLLGVFLFFGGPEAYRYSLDKLLLGWAADRQLPPLNSIEVAPGNARTGKHTDLEVRARPHGFDSRAVKIQVRYDGQPQWEEAAMQPETVGNEFLFLFHDVREPFEYYVAAEGIHSDRFRVEVAEIPRVNSIEVTLKYPAFTGLSPSTQEEGDIRALQGTRVEFRITTDQPVEAGKIRMSRKGEVPLHRIQPTVLEGSFEVSADDFYRIHLLDRENFWNPGSDEFLVTALEDRSPSLSFRRPGRDLKVTNIEEVDVELEAEDDYGIHQLSLRYSVNGGPDRTVSLNVPRGATSVNSHHTFLLEEYDLLPGDFVSYYAEASDTASSSRTDIYFLEIEPFERAFFQSQEGGMMGFGGEGDQFQLSRRQRDIIAATFNLQRESDSYTDAEFAEHSQTLALSQQRLQVEVQTIVERIQRREAAARDPQLRQMASHLQKADEHMEPAHRHLSRQDMSAALPEEQKALQQLLRSETLFRDIQVSFAQNPSPGAPSVQDLTDLVDLELDRTRNQYETLQQQSRSNRGRELDETLEKLRDLARRQQQEVERRRQTAPSSSSGGFGQDQLMDEAERMARQLERLSRERQDQRLGELSRQLEQAAREMRRSQSTGQGSAEAQMHSQRALERLEEAERELTRHRQEDFSAGMRRLRDNSQELAQRQREVADRIGELGREGREDQIRTSDLREMRQQIREKSRLQQDLHGLEADIHEMARRLEGQEPASARKLREAGRDIRDRQLPEKMQEGSQFLTRGWTGLARSREENLTQEMEEVARKIAEAEQALGEGRGPAPEERLQQALNEVGKLVENLESLHQRAQEGQRQATQGEEEGSVESAGQTGQDAPSGEPSQMGESGDGDAGSGPGQQTSPSPGRQEGLGAVAGPAQATAGINPTRALQEWQQRLGEAQNIRELLGDRQDLSRNLQELERRMRQLEMDQVLADPQGLGRLKAQVIDGFRQLELELSRSLKEDPEERLRLVQEDDIPSEYRDRVEEYYRALARSRGEDR